MATNQINIVITAQDKASKPIRDVSQSTDELTGSTSKFGSVMMTLGKAGIAAGIAGFASLAAGAVSAAKTSYDQVKAVEEARFGLQAYEKDASKVSRVLDGLVAYAKSDMGVLFNRKDLFDAASTLKMYGDATDSLTDHVKILSKGVAQGKTTFQELSGIIGRSAAKGRLDAVDFDMLIERGIGLDRRFRGATVSANDLWKALNNAIPDATLAGRADTIEGRMIRLQSAWRSVGDAILGVDQKTNNFIAGGLGDRIQKGISLLTEKLRMLAPFIRDLFRNVEGSLRVIFSGEYKADWFAGLDENNPAIKFFKVIHDAAKQAYDFIKPSIDRLVNAFNQELAPAFEKLWATVGPKLLPGLKMLAIAIGGALIGALWLLIEGLTAVTKAASFTADVITNLVNGFDQGLKAVLTFAFVSGKQLAMFFNSIPALFENAKTSIIVGVAGAAQAVTQWFQNLPGMIAFALGAAVGRLMAFATVDVPSFVNSAIQWFQQLPNQAAMALMGLYNTVTGWFTRTTDDAAQTVPRMTNAVVSEVQTLPARIANALSAMWANVRGSFEALWNATTDWTTKFVENVVGIIASLPDRINGIIRGAAKNMLGWFTDLTKNFMGGVDFGFNAHASGTNYAPGGLTRINEHGPEIVRMPTGAEVIPAYRSRQMQTAGASVVIQNYNSYNDRDDKRFFRDLGFALELAS